jgi:hypothetical protein
MTSIKVTSKKGTANRAPPYGSRSWLEFWEKAKGRKATRCEVINCYGPPELGGHVTRAEGGGREYILPMCHVCNDRADGTEFEARDFDLASTV